MGPPPRRYAPSRALPARLLLIQRSCSTTAYGPSRFPSLSQPPLPKPAAPARLPMVGQPLPTRHQIPGCLRNTASGPPRLPLGGQPALP